MIRINTEKELLQYIKNARIAVLTGPSCCGKGWLSSRLTAGHGFTYIIECTTRPMRPGEQSGRDAHFMSEKDFMQKVISGMIFEHRTYDTVLDGVPATWHYGSIHMPAGNNMKYVTGIGIKGAEAYVNHYDKNDLAVIWLDAPADIRTQRAKTRPGYSEPEWERRLISDADDFSMKNLMELEGLLGKDILCYMNC